MKRTVTDFGATYHTKDRGEAVDVIVTLIEKARRRKPEQRKENKKRS